MFYLVYILVMSPLFKITILLTLCCFAFSSTATAMLCDMNDMDTSEINESIDNNHSDSCHDEPQQSSDNSTDDCCHDMNLCHATSLLSNNSSLSQIDIIHFPIPIMENDNLIINSSSPPDRPPKYNA